MGARRNADKTTKPPEATRKLTEAQRQKILRLYDKPYALAEISRELAIPIRQVREALLEMSPLDRAAPWM